MGVKPPALDADESTMLRAERVVSNQILFREVNEEISTVAASLSDASDSPVIRFPFLCECADKRCTQAIAMTADEYETVRADPLAFVVAPGHEVPTIEHLEQTGERFHIVRKFHPEPSRIARTHDPRTRSSDDAFPADERSRARNPLRSPRAS